MLPLSLQPGHDYFDGKVEVYGRFGKPGDFTPDPKYTPQVVEDVRAALRNAMTTGERTSGWELIVKHAMDAGIATQMHVRPDHVGVHPDNRREFGIDGCHSQKLLSDMLDTGFSWKRCEDSRHRFAHTVTSA